MTEGTWGRVGREWPRGRLSARVSASPGTLGRDAIGAHWLPPTDMTGGVWAPGPYRGRALRGAVQALTAARAGRSEHTVAHADSTAAPKRAEEWRKTSWPPSSST